MAPSSDCLIEFSRLYFKNMVRGETERERLLILYQVWHLAVVHSFAVAVVGIRH